MSETSAIHLEQKLRESLIKFQSVVSEVELQFLSSPIAEPNSLISEQFITSLSEYSQTVEVVLAANQLLTQAASPEATLAGISRELIEEVAKTHDRALLLLEKMAEGDREQQRQAGKALSGLRKYREALGTQKGGYRAKG